MRRFEHPSGKFWAVDTDGSKLRVRWGATGTPGQQIDRECNTAKAAFAKEREQIERQLALGYVEVTDPKLRNTDIAPGERWLRRFENTGYLLEIELDGAVLRQRRGPLGDDARLAFERHEHEDESVARDTAMRMITAAAGEGFRLISEHEPLDDDDEQEGTPLAAAANPELEAQCRAAPDDAASWAVYADWLMQAGDPRGELAALVVRGAPTSEFIRANHIALYGSDDLWAAVEVTAWRHGFPLGVTIKVQIDDELQLVEATRELLAVPLAQFVEQLRFGLAGFESNNDWTPVMDVVTTSPRAGDIRSLRFDAYTYADQEISWTAFGDFSAAWAKLPALEELAIRSGIGGTLGKLVLPRLRRFTRISGGLSAAELQAICEAHWPLLESLELWLGTHAYNGQASVDRLLPILAARGLPELRHLALCNAEIVDTLIPELARSAVLKQLRTLDLSKGTMGSVATTRLVDEAAKFAHLEALDLSENCLTSEECSRIRAALPQCNLDDQRGDREDGDEDHDEDDRYVAIGE
ncbi:MAG TPA: TIGR02996 domain-containing protein [Kofleriaceae bacterium]|nr:TIGR02996 domain-containing protein [Kofleriaceae bacterium]